MLFVNLLGTVVSLLLRIVTGCRVVTLLHNLAFGDLLLLNLLAVSGENVCYKMHESAEFKPCFNLLENMPM